MTDIEEFQLLTMTYAKMMAKKLYHNSYKGTWEIDNLQYYLAKLHSEVAELTAEIELMRTTGYNLTDLIFECIDVMNYALIIAEVAKRIAIERTTK